MGILTLISRQHAGLPDQPADFSVTDRFLMVCQTIVFYWKQILFPGGLSIWYPFVRDNGAWHWTYYAAPLILVTAMYAAWRLRRTAPVIMAGLAFYLANIILSLPFATFGTFELRSDRYNYLAIIGVLLILASIPELLRVRRPSLANTAWGVLCAAGIIFMVKSGLRIRDWQNSLKLIESSMAAAGDNFGKAYLWRGIMLAEQGKYPQAVQDFDKAISINSQLYEARKQRGNLMGPMKKFEQSVADLSVYLAVVPDAAAEYYNRGLSYINLGKTDEAMADFSRCIELDPGFARAYRARGNTYLKLGETKKGQSDLEKYEALGGGK
jgi:tetratricopeptide (TPR) repeat protein